MALQEPSEAHIAEYFHDVNLAAIHAGRVTVKEKDFAFQVPQEALKKHTKGRRKKGIRIQQVLMLCVNKKGEEEIKEGWQMVIRDQVDYPKEVQDMDVNQLVLPGVQLLFQVSQTKKLSK
jgi:hypothetical protein